jgi:hypothetical protein
LTQQAFLFALGHLALHASAHLQFSPQLHSLAVQALGHLQASAAHLQSAPQLQSASHLHSFTVHALAHLQSAPQEQSEQHLHAALAAEAAPSMPNTKPSKSAVISNCFFVVMDSFLMVKVYALLTRPAESGRGREIVR